MRGTDAVRHVALIGDGVRIAVDGEHHARTGTALEINASPQRLDLPSDHIRAARDAGVMFAIDSDAHSVADQGNLPYGVGTAQRGWLTSDDVINTWPLDRLRAFLRKGR